MWFMFGRFRCQACDTVIPVANRAGRSPHRRGFAVCKKCYGGWDRGGRKCTRCHNEVKGTQEVAFFGEGKSFGHFDCGGIQLV